ncbi:transcriptional regulator [Pandoraea horticolens]|uniref:Transcriptional regulator n=1 Tax=Pandoraea horticolens TaxID=2508298 RepID=A0A5E4XH07_9BURK|nr:helix-turn-helix domain-containing protein [Pandoraea horticolens]VVE35567.1 transcriptional regulator [Pandoraea horticolens]
MVDEAAGVDASLAQAEQDLARLLATLADGRRESRECRECREGREGRESLSLARLAKRSALPMSTLLRYLGVLTSAGWVSLEDGERGLRLVRLTDAGIAQCDSLR